MPRIIPGCHNWGCYWHLVGRGCYTSHDTQSQTLLARRGSPRPGRRGSGAGSVRLATHSTLLLATERPCTRSGHAPSARCMHGAVRALPPPPASARHVLLTGHGERWPPWDRGGGEVREGVAAGLSGRQLAGRAPTRTRSEGGRTGRTRGGSCRETGSRSGPSELSPVGRAVQTRLPPRGSLRREEGPCGGVSEEGELGRQQSAHAPAVPRRLLRGAPRSACQGGPTAEPRPLPRCGTGSPRRPRPRVPSRESRGQRHDTFGEPPWGFNSSPPF